MSIKTYLHLPAACPVCGQIHEHNLVTVSLGARFSSLGHIARRPSVRLGIGTHGTAPDDAERRLDIINWAASLFERVRASVGLAAVVIGMVIALLLSRLEGITANLGRTGDVVAKTIPFLIAILSIALLRRTASIDDRESSAAACLALLECPNMRKTFVWELPRLAWMRSDHCFVDVAVGQRAARGDWTWCQDIGIAPDAAVSDSKLWQILKVGEPCSQRLNIAMVVSALAIVMSLPLILFYYILYAVRLLTAEGTLAGLLREMTTLSPTVRTVVNALGDLLLALIVTHYWTKWFTRGDLRSIGAWLRPGSLRRLAQGAAFGLLLSGALVALLVLFRVYEFKLPSTQGRVSYIGPLFAYTLIFLFAAAREEVMMRGFAFRVFESRLGVLAAIVLSSVVYSSVHLLNPGTCAIAFLGIFVNGILLAQVYLVTRSLWFCTGLHFTWNFGIGAVFGLPISGLAVESVFKSRAVSESFLLTGGAFGPEASILFCAVMLLGIVGVGIWKRLVT